MVIIDLKIKQIFFSKLFIQKKMKFIIFPKKIYFIFVFKEKL